MGEICQGEFFIQFATGSLLVLRGLSTIALPVVSYLVDSKHFRLDMGDKTPYTRTHMNTQDYPLTKGLTIDPAWIMNTREMNGYLHTVPLMADIISRDLHLAKNEAEMLYFYKDGKYHPKGEIAVKEAYNRVLDIMLARNEWDKVMETKLIDYLCSRAPYILDKPDLYRINLKNGIYCWEDGTFEPHTPDYYTITQLPVSYDPEATCPTWMKFLDDILPGGQQFLLEVIGLLTVPYVGNQKCIILFGPGGNGKSTFMTAVSKFIGKENISNIPLHTLTDKNDRFSKAGLLGKLLNFYADLSTKQVEDTSSFKTLTGEDSIPIEFKGKQQFYAEPYARFIFSSQRKVTAKGNEEDPDEGWMRRIVHVPFMQTYSVNNEEGRRLKELLVSESELSGLFNAVTPLIANVIENGFTISPEIADIIEMYTPVNKSTKEWLEATIRVDPEGVIPSSGLYNMYSTHCPITEPVSAQKLNMYLKSMFPSVQINKSKRFGPEKKVTNCYCGITLATPELWDNLINQAGFKYGRPQTQVM